MVPLGLRHICFSPNSFTRASSGVMVAHCRTGALAQVLGARMCARPRKHMRDSAVRPGARGAAPAAGRATHLDANAIFLPATVQNWST